VLLLHEINQAILKMNRRITLTPDWFLGKARSGNMPRRSVALSLSLLVFITISIFCVLSFTEPVHPLVYAHLGACNDLSLTDEEPEDLEEWQKERYLSEKFQYELETPQAKCTGELGVKIHNQLQADLHTAQHPSDCNGRFLIWKLGKGGFGQEVRKLAYQLAIAYAENRTLVLDTSTPWKYTDKELCPEQSLYCYFEPITQCTMDDVYRVHQQNRGESPIPVWSEDTPNERVVFGHYNTSKWRFFTPTQYGTLLSLEWFRSELLYYVLQPNEYTQAIVKEEKEKLGLPTQVDHVLPYIAIHVRGGDKHTEYKLHPFQEYLNKAKWFKTLYGVPNIFLVSDDAEVISQALEQPEGFNIIWSLNDRDKGGSQEVSEVGHQVMVKVLKDIFIASQCQFWIGTLSSNFGDTIWELMVARNAGTVPPYVSLDIPWTTHNQPNVFI